MNFYCRDHQGKAKAYVQALKDAGYLQMADREAADFLLIDIDVIGRVEMIEHFARRGMPVFLYPHTARPVLQWDGMYAPRPEVTAIFTIARGGGESARLYG